MPVQDSTVVPLDFGFFYNNGSHAGTSFSTYRIDQPQTAHQINDEYITIEFTPKSSVSKVIYTKGTLRGINGAEVETQSLLTELE